jgi:hypothetical protein
MAVTGLFRTLGGAVGAAVVGAVFAAQVARTGTVMDLGWTATDMTQPGSSRRET